MNKNYKNTVESVIIRKIALLLPFFMAAVILFPVEKVDAIVSWDSGNKRTEVKYDLSDEPLVAGKTYVYDRLLTGETGSKALFINCQPDLVHPEFDMSDTDTVNYGKLEIVDKHFCYTPAEDLKNITVEVVLNVEIFTNKLMPAYRLIFQVVPGQADAESGGLSFLGYCLNGGQSTAVEGYQPEVQNYQVSFSPDTPVGASVSLSGTPLDSQATVSLEPSVIELSQEVRTQTLTVTTPDGASRQYTVDFWIRPPEISPSVKINGTEYRDGDEILLDYGETVQFDIDVGSGSVGADSFGVWIETDTSPGCLRPIFNDYGDYSQFFSEVINRGSSSVTICFYRESIADEVSVEEICLTVKTRADYQKIIAALDEVPEDLRLYTEETVQAFQQVKDSVNYNLDFSAQPAVSQLAAQLVRAINALEIRAADYSRIDCLVEKFYTLPDIYTSESMQAVKNQIQKIDRDLDILSQATVDSCAVDLKDAIDGLTVRSEEYTPLQELFKQIPEDLSGYSESTVDRLRQTLANVKEQLVSAEENQLAECVTAVRQVIAGLRPVGSADIWELEKFLETLPDSFEQYTAQTVQTVHEWKEKAAALLMDSEAEQQQVDNCLEQLKAAVSGLMLRPADYSSVQDVLDQLPDDLSTYTSESVETVTQLIAGIDWNLDITHQQQLELLAERLQQGIGQLVPNPVTEIKPEEQPDKTVSETVPDISNPDDTAFIVVPELIIPDEIVSAESPDIVVSESSGWKRENGESVFYQDGKKVTGWNEIDGEKYYFTDDGYMAYGWLQLEDQWYYMGNDGVRQTGWVKLGNAWYYLAEDTGLMAADQWMTLDGQTYCFYDWGGMVSSSWKRLGQEWYFFNGGGYMVKDKWIEWKGDWYYLLSDGKMAVDTITPDGYRVDENGVWVR